MKKFLFLALACFSLFTASNAIETTPPKEEWVGEKYHVESGQQQDTAHRVLALVTFVGNEDVLDVGCGSGKITHDLRTQFVPNGSVTGLDKCPSQIKKAQQEYADISGLTFQGADATQLNFDEAFHVVTCFNTLHWIKNIALAFAGIAKSLKPDGTFVACLSIDDLTTRYSIGMPLIREMMHSEQWGHYFPSKETDWNNFGIQDYEQALEQAGLKGNIDHVTLPDWTFENKEAAVRYFSMIPLKSEIPAELKPEFINDYVNRYAELYPPNPDGTYRFGRKETIIVAQKNPC